MTKAFLEAGMQIYKGFFILFLVSCPQFAVFEERKAERIVKDSVAYYILEKMKS